MSYKNRFGSTRIRDTERDNLSIGWDHNTYKDKPHWTRRFPVLLFTPWMKQTKDHHHISLSRAQARKLRDWLNAYLGDFS